MKLEPGEELIIEEEIEPAAREAIQPILDECDSLKEQGMLLASQGMLLASQLDALKAKAAYLHKLKWSLFDKFHPKTTPGLHEKGDMHIIRRYDWDSNKVGVVRSECDHPSIEVNGIGLGDLLSMLAGKRKEHKQEGPQAPESAPMASAGG